MGYVGNQTTTAFTSMAKQDITGDGGTGYTLDHAVANAQEIEVFVNNVRQEPGTAYTVSGTTLTMTGNVASTDDFYVVYQGKAIQTSVPADNTVTTAMLQDSSVATAKIADTGVTTAKIAANAVTEAKMFSGFYNGISHLDVFYLTQDVSVSTSAFYLSNWASYHDTKNFKRIGAAMTVTSGQQFTFPVTGLWRVYLELALYTSNAARYFEHEIRFSTDSGNNFDSHDAYDNLPHLQSGTTYGRIDQERFVNVTNASTARVAIAVSSSASTNVQGNSADAKNITRLTFMRIGDAQ